MPLAEHLICGLGEFTYFCLLQGVRWDQPERCEVVVSWISVILHNSFNLEMGQGVVKGTLLSEIWDDWSKIAEYL